MAIIKCPECGQQVSDSAESCPHCGIRIVDNVKTCPDCGTVVKKGDAACPSCGHTFAPEAPAASATEAYYEPEQKSRKGLWITLAVVVAVLVIGAGIYAYSRYSAAQESEQAWEQLTADPASTASAYQLFIDTYPDSEHCQEAELMIKKLNEEEAEWTNALNTGSEKEIQKYLETHPESVYKNLAINKLDSFAWEKAVKANSDEAYEMYLDKFPEGVHATEAHDYLDNLSKQQLSPTEMAMIKGTFTQFFNALASADEEGLCAQVESVMDKFLNISSATKTDVMRFMKAKHASDISSIRYTLNNDYKVTKNEVDGESTFTSTFTVDEHIERSDASKENYANYRINAKITSSGKISEFTMHKITSRTGE
ncbi:MAG: zinc ribbon domain-containing protein [Paludibacteraceae bacterium]|nr:zinc ribbon domain-containing protein [Paludibacteraceae bacterium]MBR6287657.1 zinc ribbon domain-containing protein [Bacteroidaceae bacterium]